MKTHTSAYLKNWFWKQLGFCIWIRALNYKKINNRSLGSLMNKKLKNNLLICNIIFHKNTTNISYRVKACHEAPECWSHVYTFIGKEYKVDFMRLHFWMKISTSKSFTYKLLFELSGPHWSNWCRLYLKILWDPLAYNFMIYENWATNDVLEL